jgi:AcrR family transcriptional regulator
MNEFKNIHSAKCITFLFVEAGCMMNKKADIFDSAREMFYSKGYKQTKISGIARMAGVSVGTFYSCYTSKEELFLEVFIRESEDVKKSIFESIDLNDDPTEAAGKFVEQNIDAMSSNPILREWYNRDLFNRLKLYFHERGDLKRIDEFILNGKAELNKRWKDEGIIRDDLSDEMINAMFDSILYIEIHKSEIGIKYFPQILHYITEFIMKGLYNFKDKKCGSYFLSAHE